MSLAPSKILLVEDDPALEEILAAGLQPDNIVVEGVRNGPEALKRSCQNSYDLILLDLGLPGMNGFEVLQRLKSEAASQSTPVILLTGWQAIGDKLRGFELGAVDYITKPFQLVELRARIGATLRTKRLQDELTQANRQLEALHLAADQNAHAKTEALATLHQEIQKQMSRVLRTANSLLPANLTAEQRGEVETIRASAESLLNLTQRNESRG